MSIVISGPLAPTARNVAYVETLRPHVGVVMPWLVAPVDYLETACDDCAGKMWISPVDMALRSQLRDSGAEVHTLCFYDAVRYSEARVLILRGFPGGR